MNLVINVVTASLQLQWSHFDMCMVIPSRPGYKINSINNDYIVHTIQPGPSVMFVCRITLDKLSVKSQWSAPFVETRNYLIYRWTNYQKGQKSAHQNGRQSRHRFCLTSNHYVENHKSVVVTVMRTIKSVVVWQCLACACAEYCS
jgi:hypothetical protein